MKIPFLLTMMFYCSLTALDGAAYDIIFGHVQTSLGVKVVGDKTKLMAESIVTAIESKAGGKPALILITPGYFDEKYVSTIPRETQNIYLYSPDAPYGHLGTIHGMEYIWTKQGDKIVIWSDAWTAKGYKRTKYSFDGKALSEISSHSSPFKSELKTE
ncbi:MAG: hypothetical protein AAB263_15375 [Planctomycetota bacterium]